MRAAAQALGYFEEGTAKHHKDMVMAMFDIAFEAQCFEGEYDFSQSGMAARLNPRGFELMKDRSFWQVPPTSVLLLQRKAAGLFLLAVKLRAKVNINALVKSVTKLP